MGALDVMASDSVHANARSLGHQLFDANARINNATIQSKP
jgi:hypothetical protein